MDIIGDIIRREGGFVNHPADRGGPTKYGITIWTLSASRGHSPPCTAADVEALTEAEARQIYARRYIAEPGLDKITDPKLQALVVDIGVMSGPVKAKKLLQEALGATVDGIFGSQTYVALNTQNPDGIYRRLVAARMRDLGRIITGDPSQSVFAAGWLNRLSEFLA